MKKFLTLLFIFFILDVSSQVVVKNNNFDYNKVYRNVNFEKSKFVYNSDIVNMTMVENNRVLRTEASCVKIPVQYFVVKKIDLNRQKKLKQYNFYKNDKKRHKKTG